MSAEPPGPSARETHLLEAAYRYALDHGLANLSLRPLATAIGSSPRVLLYLFEDKDSLVRALLDRARADELALLKGLRDASDGEPLGLPLATEQIWTWLSAVEHRPLLTLWTEAYARSLVDPDGAWAGFAQSTVEDWLAVLATAQPITERNSPSGEHRRTLALAVLRGALIDLLATGDTDRATAAVRHQVRLLDTTDIQAVDERLAYKQSLE